MPLEKTQEELLASKINPRNYSAILPIIYNLKKTANAAYVPEAPTRIIYNAGAIGDGAGTTAQFTTITASCTRGGTITLTGTANYILTDGVTSIIKPATNVVAQINMNIKNTIKGLFPLQINAKGSEISSNGVFSFIIPSEVTEKLIIGTHYVYIDACSPDNAPVRLSAPGTETDPTKELYFTRTFTITE